MADLDIQKNFKTIATWEEAREVLDVVFSRISDLLSNNPSLISLVDEREGIPPSNPGDLVTDFRDGSIRLKMSDGKNLLDIGISSLGGSMTATQHGALPGVYTDAETGTQTQMHSEATTTEAGFMSATDKVKLNGLDGGASPSSALPMPIGANNTAAAGTSAAFARGDHVHAIAVAGTTVAIGSNTGGSANTLARGDHSHAHGAQGGGTQHTEATTSTAGFMSSGDKSKVNMINAYNTGTAHLNNAGDFGPVNISGAFYWAVNIGGVVRTVILT